MAWFEAETWVRGNLRFNVSRLDHEFWDGRFCVWFRGSDYEEVGQVCENMSIRHCVKYAGDVVSMHVYEPSDLSLMVCMFAPRLILVEEWQKPGIPSCLKDLFPPLP